MLSKWLFVLIIVKLFNTLVLTSEDVCKNRTQQRCNCDLKLCNLYDNCCYKKRAHDLAFPYSKFHKPSCVWRRDINKNQPIFLWNKCSKSYPQSNAIRSLCEVEPYTNVASFLPAYTKEGFLFKNIFCGLCNYVDKSQILIPHNRNTSIKMTCMNHIATKPKSEADFLNLLNDATRHCHFSYVIPNSVKRSCYDEVVSKCLQNHPLKYDCEMSGRLWYTQCRESNKVYANPACANCNLLNCTEYFNLEIKTEFVLMSALHGYDYSMILNLDILENVNQASNNSSTNSTGTNSAMSVVNTVFLSLSIISLFVLLLIHLLVKELRDNVNGILTIGLSICLALGMLLFLVAIQFEGNIGWCQTIALLIHFLYLCSFTLMSLTAFDLVKTFLSKAITQHSMSKRKIISYSLAAFGIPFIIVSVAFMVNALRPDSPIAPAYGRGFCWFNRKYGLLTWFFIPASVSILFNMTVCLILIRFFITAYRQSSQAIKTKRQLLIICLKISVILGFSWGLMLIESFVQNDIYTFFASCCNSLQGVFIAISFIINRRVRQTLRSSMSTRLSSFTSGSRADSSFQTVKYTSGKRENSSS